MAEPDNEIRTLDLFCGAGGFSKGFEMAGYKVLRGIDYNAKFKDTYEFNHKNAKFIHYDLLDGIIKDFQSCDIDFIIGSPPCQGFSDARGNRDEKNKSHMLRNTLPFRHIDWVNDLRPEIALLENVSGMATKKYGKNLLLELLIEEFIKARYNVRIGLLNSMYYGVPQERVRVFCVAYKNKYSKILNEYPFPLPKYLPNRFKKRKPKNRKVDLWLFEETESNYFPKNYLPIRTIKDLLSDLPLNPNELKSVEYKSKTPLNEYQKYLRKKSKTKVTLHNILKEPSKDEIKILQNIPEGKIYRSSRFGERYIGVWNLFKSELAPNERLLLNFMCRFRTWKEFKTKRGNYTEGYLLEDLFKSYDFMINSMLDNGYFSKQDANKWMQIINKNNFPLPTSTLKSLCDRNWLRYIETSNGLAYDINTKSGIRPMYLRLHRDSPSRTILTTSFKVRELVHPTINRPITFREGARIQSFPDDFEFIAKPMEIATMIGNAVPPLMAKELGLYYRKVIENIDSKKKNDIIFRNLKSRNKLLTEYN